MKNEIEPSPPVIKSDTNQPSSFFFFFKQHSFREWTLSIAPLNSAGAYGVSANKEPFCNFCFSYLGAKRLTEIAPLDCGTFLFKIFNDRVHRCFELLYQLLAFC